MRTDIPLVVYEAPLLYEVGAESRVDKVLVVRVDPEEQLRRLMVRDGLSEAAAQQRMDVQMAQQEKVKRADYVIDNSGSIEKIRDQIDLLWTRIFIDE
jgi:dephospho-CoA kinase